MGKSFQGKVRPVAPFDRTLDKTSLKGASRIYINRDALIELTGSVDNGRRCVVTRWDNDETEPKTKLRREAALWTLTDKKIPHNTVLMTEAYREACGFDLGDSLTITMHENPTVPESQSVHILPMTESGQEVKLGARESAWISVSQFALWRAEQVFPGMKFECTAPGAKQLFRIVSVDDQTDNVARFTESSALSIPSAEEHAPVQEVQATNIAVSGLPGLQAEEKKLKSFLRGFNKKFRYKREHRSCGIVIHGPRGTGKTYILDRIAATGWGKVFRIEENDKASTVEEVFKQATSQQPSIILIDNLHVLIGKERANSNTIIHTLGKQLDQLALEADRNWALPKVLVAATCSDYLTDVPDQLQNEMRLENNIPLRIPNADGRLAILQALDIPIQPEIKDAMLSKLSQETHAFNARDLCKLIAIAQRVSAERLDAEDDSNGESMETSFLSKEDIGEAQKSMKPTAMHGLDLKPPTVRWEDVGGQEALKKELRFMIQLTTTTNPEVIRNMLVPPRGYIFFGPPGCSKTLLTQAIATESGFNMFSVKGAELLNMYVGESERAIRLLFERARRATPSIIFFDEIDAIGSHRTGGAGGQSQVNTLTTLLTEMDGFETLSGVLIFAATNRPEAIDPALLRPGRFDGSWFVGLPNVDERKAIFQVHLRKVWTAADVDVEELARLSDGYSGAEIKNIIVSATKPSIDRALSKVTTGGLDGQQAPGTQYDNELSGQVCMQDIVAALQATPKGVTQDMMDQYHEWQQRFRSK